MIDKDKEMIIKKQYREEALEEEIIALLKMHNLSISSTRFLFDLIIEKIEHMPLG